jgi:hypothetical protein
MESGAALLTGKRLCGSCLCLCLRSAVLKGLRKAGTALWLAGARVFSSDWLCPLSMPLRSEVSCQRRPGKIYARIFHKRTRDYT